MRESVKNERYILTNWSARSSFRYIILRWKAGMIRGSAISIYLFLWYDDSWYQSRERFMYPSVTCRQRDGTGAGVRKARSIFWNRRAGERLRKIYIRKHERDGTDRWFILFIKIGAIIYINNSRKGTRNLNRSRKGSTSTSFSKGEEEGAGEGASGKQSES